jgi:TRAP-type C4-dicarboxylate transport system substrate-binding protein
MSQIVLTSHLVGYDLLTISSTAWDAMTPEQQELVQTAATDAIDWSQAEHLKREAELAKSFEEKGLKLYEPDIAAFREHAQKMYLESDLAKSWPEGLLDKINGLGA